MMANGGSKLMSKKAWKTMHSKPKKSVFSDTPVKVSLWGKMPVDYLVYSKEITSVTKLNGT